MDPRRLAFIVSAAVCAAACNAPAAAPSFKAATDQEAFAVVRGFLDAAKAGDAKAVAARACDGGRATAAVEGKIESYEVTRVEPAWVGAEPYFRVDVVLKKAGGVDKRSLSVRAREGCVDRLLGEPVESAKPADGEIEL